MTKDLELLEDLDIGSLIALRISDGDTYWDCVAEFEGFASKHSGTFSDIEYAPIIIIKKKRNWCSRYGDGTISSFRGSRPDYFIVDVNTIKMWTVLSPPENARSVMIDDKTYPIPSWLFDKVL